jgi:Met-zincin/Domain of unknown function (DUF5117)
MKLPTIPRSFLAVAAVAATPLLLADTSPVAAITGAPMVTSSGFGGGSAGPDFPSATEVTKDFVPVVSAADGQPTFYKLWRRDKDQQLVAELPRDFANQRHYIALTVASGESYAGLQSGELYGYWRVYGKKLAFMIPNIDIRSTGDDPSKNSVKRLFTDKVLLEVPILAMVNQGGPIIDLDALIVGQAEKFFGRNVRNINKGLYQLKTVKAFPKNVEVSVEVPVDDGQLRILHYSFSLIPDQTGYTPRAADTRIGYFTTAYTDLGKFTADETRTRYINRWFLEKADPSLKLSPPKNPIIFYVEHTTPVRYRRWVQDGLLAWNKAFEKVGLINTIEVRFQDATTSEHMEKDPEDVRYNFVRWLNNGEGTAIGPSRVHPLTGQILDADIILTDGWIRHWWEQYNEVIPKLALDGMPPEGMQWLWDNPQWDPRIRMAPPAKRSELLAQRQSAAAPAAGGHAMGTAAAHNSDGFIGRTNEFEGLMGRLRQRAGLCNAPNCKTMGLAQMALCLDIHGAPAMGLPANDQTLDGVPESFIGPLLMEIVAHECGHTLGLRHNFKASSIYTYEQINSPEIKGKKPFTGSVMDYTPTNIVAGTDLTKKGDFGMIGVGPYDDWAISYGYSFEKDLKPILARVAEPELVYGTDEDTFDCDPLSTRYDFGKNPLAFAQNQIALAKEHRSLMLTKFVKDGDSWARARRGYEMTLSMQARSVSMMAQWIGGAFINRDKKGDKNARVPVQPVPAEDQRKALAFVLAQSFRDEAFGLTSDLLARMPTDKWLDDSYYSSDGSAWQVHDRVLGIQAMALTSLLSPTRLGRVYDNETRVPADQDFITLAEVMSAVRDAAWDDLDKAPAAGASARKPYLSSFRRNLQREHLDRLIDLATNASLTKNSSTYKPITDLAATQLGELKTKIDAIAGKAELDPYSRSHLQQAAVRIGRALDAQLTINDGSSGGGMRFIFMGQKPE